MRRKILVGVVLTVPAIVFLLAMAPTAIEY
jgi:hypothetical protein